jgi:hypothetical protein
VVVLGGTPVALEVDAVDEVVEDGGANVSGAATVGAAGVRQVGGVLVAMLDLGALAERLAELKEIG